MKFDREDEFVTAVIRLKPEDAERLRKYPDESILLVEGSYVVPVEVVRVGSLPEPDGTEGFIRRACNRCTVREPHSHTRC